MNQIVESKEMEMPTPLIFTDNAVKKVKALIEEEGQPELKLRVFVRGGGCSGFQYGFTFYCSSLFPRLKPMRKN